MPTDTWRSSTRNEDARCGLSGPMGKSAGHTFDPVRNVSKLEIIFCAFSTVEMISDVFSEIIS
jgi:hypothetical protein